jgi:hypothetical protein
MNGFMGSVVAIVGLFAGVAIVAALVSKNANTANVLGSGFQGIATDLSAALAPVTGGSFGAGSFTNPSF